MRTHSDNAVMAKVRALYGKRLTENDYNQLVSKRDIGEVAAYLKKETYYADHLKEVKEELIHRGMLENFVRRRPLKTYIRLSKYSQHEALFFRMYVMQNEMEQLLVFLRTFNSGRTDRYIISLPGFLARLMSFDLFRLPEVRSFDDLLELLEHSPYYRIIARFRPRGAHRIVDITGCEAALLTNYYNTLLELVDRNYRGETRDDLRRLLLHQVNLHNVMLIYRMRRYLEAPRDMIAPRIVWVEGVNRRLVERLLNAPDLRATYEILKEGRTLRQYPLDWDADTQRMSTQVNTIHQHIYQKLFRYSTEPAVVVIAYMVLLEEEVNNIVSIIEGIRYQIPSAELKTMLSL